MTDKENEQMAVPAGSRGSAHVVLSVDGRDIETACGRTLSKVGQINVGRGYYVHGIGDVPIGDKCAICPWGEIDAA